MTSNSLYTAMTARRLRLEARGLENCVAQSE